MMRGMVIDMNDEQLHTLAQLQALLDGTIEVDFAVAADERYDFIARTVRLMTGTCVVGSTLKRLRNGLLFVRPIRQARSIEAVSGLT